MKKKLLLLVLALGTVGSALTGGARNAEANSCGYNVCYRRRSRLGLLRLLLQGRQRQDPLVLRPAQRLLNDCVYRPGLPPLAAPGSREARCPDSPREGEPDAQEADLPRFRIRAHGRRARLGGQARPGLELSPDCSTAAAPPAAGRHASGSAPTAPVDRRGRRPASGSGAAACYHRAVMPRNALASVVLPAGSALGPLIEELRLDAKLGPQLLYATHLPGQRGPLRRARSAGVDLPRAGEGGRAAPLDPSDGGDRGGAAGRKRARHHPHGVGQVAGLPGAAARRGGAGGAGARPVPLPPEGPGAGSAGEVPPPGRRGRRAASRRSPGARSTTATPRPRSGRRSARIFRGW